MLKNPGVPRVWEKIEEKLKELGKKNSGLKKVVMDWAKNAALQHHTDKMAGKEGRITRDKHYDTNYYLSIVFW